MLGVCKVLCALHVKLLFIFSARCATQLTIDSTQLMTQQKINFLKCLRVGVVGVVGVVDVVGVVGRYWRC